MNPDEWKEMSTCQQLFAYAFDTSLKEYQRNYYSYFWKDLVLENTLRFLVKPGADADYIISRVSSVLKYSDYPPSMCLALDIFEDLIKKKSPKDLTSKFPNDFTSIKKLCFEIFVGICDDPKPAEGYQNMLIQVKKVLVQILCSEYPERWLSSLCLLKKKRPSVRRWMNWLDILNEMGEKLFGLKMSKLKAKVIVYSKEEFFKEMFRFCYNVIRIMSEPNLLCYSVETLKKFAFLMDPQDLFQKDLIKCLLLKINVMTNQCIVLELLAELARICPSEYRHFEPAHLFSQFLFRQVMFLSPLDYYKEAYDANISSFQKKLFSFAVFLNKILKQHGMLLLEQVPHYFNVALYYLLSICSTENFELVKLSLDCFEVVIRKLCIRKKKGDCIKIDVFGKLCQYILRNIPKPPDTQQVVNKEGEVLCEIYENPEKARLYFKLKDIIVLLTYFNHPEMIEVILKELKILKQCVELPQQNLDSVCFVAGLIATKRVQIRGRTERCMPEDIAKRFIPKFITLVMEMYKIKKINYSLMSIIRDCPHLLFNTEASAEIHFSTEECKKIIAELFSYIPVSHKRDTVCLTLVKVVRKCKERLKEPVPGEKEPFYKMFMKEMIKCASYLENEQLAQLFESLGLLAIPPHADAGENEVKQKIQEIMGAFNKTWKISLIHLNTAKGIFIGIPALMKAVSVLLSINLGFCRGIGYNYIYQLEGIFSDFFMLYELMNKCIYDNYKELPEFVDASRNVKKGMLKLVTCWISSIKYWDQCTEFLDYYLPFVQNYVISDYCKCPEPELHEPEVLSMLSTIVKTHKDLAAEVVELFFRDGLELTNNVIKKLQGKEEQQALKTEIYLFLKMVVTHCFQVLEDMFLLETVIDTKTDPENTKFYIIANLILQSTDDERKENAKSGVQISLLLLEKVNQSKFNQYVFFQYHWAFLRIMLQLVTHGLSRQEIPGKARILSKMIKLMRSNMKNMFGHVSGRSKVTVDQYLFCKIEEFLCKEFDYLMPIQHKFMAREILRHHRKVSKLTKFLLELPNLLCDFHATSFNLGSGNYGFYIKVLNEVLRRSRKSRIYRTAKIKQIVEEILKKTKKRKAKEEKRKKVKEMKMRKRKLKEILHEIKKAKTY